MINKIRNNIEYILIILISCGFFIYTFSFRIIIPTNVDWLMFGTDLTQHYLGWRAYRLSSWHFPIGMIDNLAYPNRISIIYTDSIPLLAVPFKIISGILPKDFQYFGLWGILSYVLQGVLSVKIFKQLTYKKVLIVMSSTMMILVPTVLQRMYYHSALAGQWIILIGLELLLLYSQHSTTYRYKKIFLMGLLAASVHMYFVLMCGIILVGICLQDIFNTKSIKNTLLYLAEYVCGALIIIALLGGFSCKVSGSKEGLGEYSFNLLGFINPAGAAEGGSRILPNIPVLATWADEGYAYLGCGFILLCIVSTIVLLITKPCLNSRCILSCVITSIIALMFAISPKVGFGPYQLLHVKLPDIVIRIWSVFRATGRVSWIVMYTLMFASLSVILKCANNRWALVCLIIALLIQTYDISDMISNKKQSLICDKEYINGLYENGWLDIVQENNIQHVIYMSEFNIFEMFEVTDFALDNGITTNDFYFARDNKNDLETSRENLENIDHTMFIFSKKDLSQTNEYDFEYIYTKKYIVGYKKESGD